MGSRFSKRWVGSYRERDYRSPLSTARTLVPEQYELGMKGYVEFYVKFVRGM